MWNPYNPYCFSIVKSLLSKVTQEKAKIESKNKVNQLQLDEGRGRIAFIIIKGQSTKIVCVFFLDNLT